MRKITLFLLIVFICVKFIPAQLISCGMKNTFLSPPVLLRKAKQVGLRKSPITGDKSHPAEAGFSCSIGKYKILSYTAGKGSEGVQALLPKGNSLDVFSRDAIGTESLWTRKVMTKPFRAEEFSWFKRAYAEENNWVITKSTHFIVYYKNAPETFIKQLIEKAEDYYNKIADDLGFRRYDFWLWDKRAKIYIYDAAQDYCSATAQPAWSAGSADVRGKTIKTFLFARSFFETVLPHEMGHIIFREFVGFDNNAVPLWLDEGVASYQEKLRYSMADTMVKKALEAGNFMALEKLSGLGLVSATTNDAVQLFYAESFSIVNFLIREFGRDSFVLFCQNLRDKRNLERAIISSYPFKDIRKLEETWKKYLMRL